MTKCKLAKFCTLTCKLRCLTGLQLVSVLHAHSQARPLLWLWSYLKQTSVMFVFQWRRAHVSHVSVARTPIPVLFSLTSDNSNPRKMPCWPLPDHNVQRKVCGLAARSLNHEAALNLFWNTRFLRSDVTATTSLILRSSWNYDDTTSPNLAPCWERQGCAGY